MWASGLYIGAALTTTIGRGCSLKIGAIFPQTEISPDPAEIKDFAQAVEGMGYDHIFIADHVLGADPRHHSHPSLQTYSHESVVHEIMTTMGYLAAVTKTVGLASGILILPQRQTALVAKQAAEVDRPERRPAAAGHRRGLERRRIPGSRPGLSESRQTQPRADRVDAGPVDQRSGQF